MTIATRLARQPHAVKWLFAAMATALGGSALLLAYVGWTSHERAVQEGRARVARIAQIGQQQALRIVETNEVISRSVTAAVHGRSDAELRDRRGQLHELLRGLTRGLAQLQSVWVWDASGRPLATNLMPEPPATLDVSDREYFVWARSAQPAAWYVSHPLRSRTTGQLFFDFSQRRSHADGSFAGAISVSLLPAYFTQFFRQQVEREPALSMSLLLADGSVVARYPDTPEGSRLGKDSPTLRAMMGGLEAGQVSGFSTLDHRWRYVAYRRVGELPLYVAATASQDLLLQPWRHSMLLLGAFTVPLALALAGMCGFAIQRVRREHATALALEQQYEQRLQAEQALRQAQKMEALGRLTGGVAHDFNNILMVVQSSVALARKLEERGRGVATALAPIERAVANGAQLTRQLLAIARRQPLQIRTISLQEVLPEVARLMGSTLGSRVRVDCEISGDAGPVTVDQAELELAIINLCLNARDAMPEGGRIEIRAGAVLAPAGALPSTPWVRITVADTGEGIAAEVLEKVAEPFFTTKAHGKGTGLGLSQVHGFAQQSGGRMEIASEIGRGTTVALLLPCAEVAAQPTEDARPPALEALHARVLLVEDNPDIAESLAALMVQSGASVTRHDSAEAALQALSSGAERPDVVLSDISLAGTLTGVDLARRLAQAHPGLPVVLMTGYTDRLQEAVALGLQVLPKPATPHSLLQALARALASRPAAAARGAAA